MSQQSWLPTASIDILKQRAKIIAKIRDFFSQRGVLEVETPLLSQATVTDPYLHSLSAQVNQKTYYLQTSPEYAMKRLLAAGSGPIYQLCKSFRDDEVGRFHNPEFSMLEWYRPGFNHHDLMDEMSDLLRIVLQCAPAERISYQALFLKFFDLDPHVASVEQLAEVANKYQLGNVVGVDDPDKDLYLQWLMSDIIEPKLGTEVPCFVYDYATSQAALAKIRSGNPSVAERFEVYYQGIELANGFHELADAAEQRERFERDLAKRKQDNVRSVPIDENLLAALSAGFPDCAGVALGIDRLIMLALEQKRISKVISFDTNNA